LYTVREWIAGVGALASVRHWVRSALSALGVRTNAPGGFGLPGPPR
jgi:hypothetical protein